jgi:hypothetical protein
MRRKIAGERCAEGYLKTAMINAKASMTTLSSEENLGLVANNAVRTMPSA